MRTLRQTAVRLPACGPDGHLQPRRRLVQSGPFAPRPGLPPTGHLRTGDDPSCRDTYVTTHALQPSTKAGQFQRHASPVLCPARALLVRVPLGPCPWLHRLRCGLFRFVRRLPRYYDRVRLLGFVRHRLRPFAFPMRTSGVQPRVKPEISRFSSKERPHVPGSPTTSGWAGTCDGAPVHVAFRASKHVGTQVASSFRGSMAGLCAPLPTHGSGPMWIATPSSWRTCTPTPCRF